LTRSGVDMKCRPRPIICSCTKYSQLLDSGRFQLGARLSSILGRVRLVLMRRWSMLSFRYCFELMLTMASRCHRAAGLSHSGRDGVGALGAALTEMQTRAITVVPPLLKACALGPALPVINGNSCLAPA
jgi:hypothetical protein